MHKEIKSFSIPLLLFCSSTVLAASFPLNQGSKPGTSIKPDSDQTIEIDKKPIAANDHVTIVPNTTSVVEGNVVTNDKNGSYVELTSSPVSEYGYLILNADGSFSYTLYTNAASVTDLKVKDVVTDVFTYSYIASSGHSVTANLNIQIIGNPVDADGNTVFQAPIDEPYDNVDVEFNNRSAQSTPLNSGRNIKGHLHHSGDKDWYKLASAGNEIISLEVCPQGSSCFGKKSWVLYVFDSDKITQEMEERRFTFSRWINETGSEKDESGNQIISGTNGSSNHMYLNYRTGAFDGALIGVVDPCFDTLNKVDIGVGDGARNYLVAISSPLKGDSGDAESCGGGSVVLKGPGLNALGEKPAGKCSIFEKNTSSGVSRDKIISSFKESYGAIVEGETEFKENKDKICKILIVKPDNSFNKWTIAGYNDGGSFQDEAVDTNDDLGSLLTQDSPDNKKVIELALAKIGRSKPKAEVKKYTTTQQFISVFPKSDDQYSIKITGTGLNPLLSEEAKAKSATYELNFGELKIPKVRVNDQLYSANLSLDKSIARNANKGGNLKFNLSSLNALNTQDGSDAFQATYNSKNQQVIIPRVTDLVNNTPYSIIMQYHPATEVKGQSLEVINYKLIK